MANPVADELEIRQLVAAYADAVNRRDQDLWASTWAEECQWTLPGGGLEFGEHPEEAMVREVQEETGLTVKPEKVAGIDTFTRENTDELFQSIRIVYQTVLLGGELRFESEGTTDMCQWHPLSGIDELEVVSLVKAAVKMTIKG